jgi:hypothetical protein
MDGLMQTSAMNGALRSDHGTSLTQRGEVATILTRPLTMGRQRKRHQRAAELRGRQTTAHSGGTALGLVGIIRFV